jgi:hypothetical protein
MLKGNATIHIQILKLNMSEAAWRGKKILSLDSLQTGRQPHYNRVWTKGHL